MLEVIPTGPFQWYRTNKFKFEIFKLGLEWAEWSRCTSWCSKGKRTRLWFDNVTQELTESRDLQNSRQDCDGEDLFCALSLGLPGVFALVATLGIYTLCRLVSQYWILHNFSTRSKSTSDLSRGRKALLSYRTVFGARKSRQKAEAARKVSSAN